MNNQHPLDALPTGPASGQRQLVNIFGAPGEGKTTLMAAWYRLAVERGVPALWIDTTGANSYLARAGRHQGAVCAAVRTLDGFVAAVSAALRAGRPWNVVLSPEGADLAPLWTLLLRLGNCLVAVDEMDEYAPARAILDGKPLGRLVSQGRNFGVSMLQTVRVPGELHGRFKGMATAVVSFRQADAAAADTIARDFMHQRQLAPHLLRLPPFTFIRADRSGRVTRGTVPRLPPLL